SERSSLRAEALDRVDSASVFHGAANRRGTFASKKRPSRAHAFCQSQGPKRQGRPGFSALKRSGEPADFLAKNNAGNKRLSDPISVLQVEHSTDVCTEDSQACWTPN